LSPAGAALKEPGAPPQAGHAPDALGRRPRPGAVPQATPRTRWDAARSLGRCPRLL